MVLIDVRTSDGSRHFARLPAEATREALADHLLLLSGAEMTSLVTGNGGKPWMDFAYQGHRFSVSRHEDRFHFFVCDPLCPDVLLYQVASHFEQLFSGVAIA